MAVLQQLIGVDKKNPLFSVFKKSSTNELHIYYGAILYEVIKNHKDNPEYKMMIARLYNAGVKIKSLIENFGYSYPTMRRWGKVLKSGDMEQIYISFSGQGAQKKLTPEITSFVIHDFENVYPQNKYSYSFEIRENIKKIYKLSISSELLRPIFNELKASYRSNSILTEQEKKKIYKQFIR